MNHPINSNISLRLPHFGNVQLTIRVKLTYNVAHLCSVKITWKPPRAFFYHAVDKGSPICALDEGGPVCALNAEQALVDSVVDYCYLYPWGNPSRQGGIPKFLIAADEIFKLRDGDRRTMKAGLIRCKISGKCTYSLSGRSESTLACSPFLSGGGAQGLTLIIDVQLRLSLS